jgi:hypothetical protein
MAGPGSGFGADHTPVCKFCMHAGAHVQLRRPLAGVARGFFRPSPWPLRPPLHEAGKFVGFRNRHPEYLSLKKVEDY